MTTLVAAHVGEGGFVRFLGELVRLGVITRDEKLQWLALHGLVLRFEEPLDDGRRFDEDALAALADELGGRVE